METSTIPSTVGKLKTRALRILRGAGGVCGAALMVWRSMLATQAARLYPTLVGLEEPSTAGLRSEE